MSFFDNIVMSDVFHNLIAAVNTGDFSELTQVNLKSDNRRQWETVYDNLKVRIASSWSLGDAPLNFDSQEALVADRS